MWRRREREDKLSQKLEIHLGDRIIPVEIILERRNSWRCALGKSAVLVRVTPMKASKLETTVLPWVKRWLLQVCEERPNLLDRYTSKKYEEGERIKTVFQTTHEVRFQSVDHPTITNDQLILPDMGTPVVRGDEIARLFAGFYHDMVHQEVHRINFETYQVDIRSVKCRNNSSRWGSCSSAGNINLNTKLLISTKAVFYSVVIHELTHRIQPNHSNAFWQLVRQYDPDCDKSKEWLKTYGSYLRF